MIFVKEITYHKTAIYGKRLLSTEKSLWFSGTVNNNKLKNRKKSGLINEANDNNKEMFLDDFL